MLFLKCNICIHGKQKECNNTNTLWSTWLIELWWKAIFKQASFTIWWPIVVSRKSTHGQYISHHPTSIVCYCIPLWVSTHVCGFGLVHPQLAAVILQGHIRSPKCIWYKGHNFAMPQKSPGLCPQLFLGFPLSLLKLPRKGGSHVKKSTCRLILQLCCFSFSIRKEKTVLQVKEALLEEMSEDSNDICFLFLFQVELCSPILPQ